MVDIARVRRKARAQKVPAGSPKASPEAAPEAPSPAEAGSAPETPSTALSEVAPAGLPVAEPTRPEPPARVSEAPEGPPPVSPDQIMARLFKGIPSRERGPARPAAEAVEAGEAFLVFALAGEWYAVPLDRVRYIWSVRWVPAAGEASSPRERVEAFTRVPDAPPEVRGVMSLRGRMVAVYDTYRRLGLEAQDLTRLWVLVLQDGEDRVGLLIERRSYVHRVPPDAVQPPPLHLSPDRSEYLRGILHHGDRVIGVLDLERFLALAPAGTA